jgi:hypothetical protein
MACSAAPSRGPAEGGDEPGDACPAWAGDPSYRVVGDGLARELGLEPSDCGFEHERFGEEAELCCESIGQRRQCLLDALEGCSPARYTDVFSTVEGDPIVMDYFVVPQAGTCELVEVHDSSRDKFGDPNALSITTRHCARATLSAPAGNSCPRLGAEGCVF